MAAHPEDSSAYVGAQGSILGLLKRLMDDAGALAHNELSLAKTEFRDALFELKAGMASLAIGLMVLITGVLSLAAAGVLALSHLMESWLAALLIGLGLTLIGTLLFFNARKKLLSPAEQLDRTGNSIKKDAAVVARRT